MVRTALRSALAAAALIVPAASVDARPPVVVYPRVVTYAPPRPVCRSWEVMYRSCAAEPWRCYGAFDNANRAERTAHHLRHRGVEVFVSVR